MNLILQLTQAHPAPELQSERNAVIAMYFVLIPLFPVTAFFTWQRYRRARAAYYALGSATSFGPRSS